MMLSISSDRYSNLRDKNRMFNKWKQVIQRRETFVVSLELTRLNREVELLRAQENQLKSNFDRQKSDLEAKINTLLNVLLRGATS